MNPFEGLPDELVTDVLSDIDLDSLISLRYTDRRFRAIASDVYERRQRKYYLLNREESGNPVEFDSYVRGLRRDFKKDYEKHLYKDAFTPDYFKLKRHLMKGNENRRAFNPLFNLDLNLSWLDLPLVPREIEDSPVTILTITYCPVREIVPRLSRAKQLSALLLYLKELDVLPEDIFESESIKTLRILEMPMLCALPRNVGRSKLEVLQVHGTAIAQIPEAVFDVKTLRCLYLSGNKIKEIPTGISRLKSIEHIDVRNNSLERVCPEIGKLPRLKVLQLEGNPDLKELPASIADLESIEQIYYDPALQNSRAIDLLVAKRGGTKTSHFWSLSSKKYW